MTALGVGSVDGKQRQEPVATLHSLATRIASHSSTLQGQRTPHLTDLSRTTTSQSIGAQHSRPVSKRQITPQSPLTSIHPASATNTAVASVHNQPVPTTVHSQHPLQNGGPPERISIPPRPTDFGRTETDFFTPPSDPAEIKRLQ